MVETYTPSLMQLTNGAVHKILSLKDSESNNDTLNLRVYVTGGGHHLLHKLLDSKYHYLIHYLLKTVFYVQLH